MCRMAVRANSTDDQSLVFQRLPVDTPGIIIVGINFIQLGTEVGFSFFTVTFSAKGGDIGPVIGRGIIVPGFYFMRSMAVRTIGGIFISFQVSLSMTALIVKVRYLGMTIGTIHFPCCLAGILQPGRNVCMALDTRDIPVNRIGQVGLQHLQGYHRIIDYLVDILFTVTFQAGTVREGRSDVLDIHFMWYMAVGAGRHISRVLFPQLALDDLFVHLGDQHMTFHACLCNVLFRDRRIQTGIGQDQMIPMTVVAGSCNQQTLLEQTVSVDALAVVLQDIVFTDIVDPCHRRSFPVALPAQAGYIQFVSTGGAVRGG